MATVLKRAHVVVPEGLVASVDRLVGKRGRSKFFAEAAAEKLARLHLAAAAREAAGSLVNEDIPGWETSEAAADWVHGSRRVAEAQLNRRQADP